jgi:hypothetical protein
MMSVLEYCHVSSVGDWKNLIEGGENSAVQRKKVVDYKVFAFITVSIHTAYDNQYTKTIGAYCWVRVRKASLTASPRIRKCWTWFAL